LLRASFVFGFFTRATTDELLLSSLPLLELSEAALPSSAACAACSSNISLHRNQASVMSSSVKTRPKEFVCPVVR